MKAETAPSTLKVAKIPSITTSTCPPARNRLITVPKTPIHTIADLFFYWDQSLVYVVGGWPPWCWIPEHGDLSFMEADSFIDGLVLASNHNRMLHVDLLRDRWCDSCLFNCTFFGAHASLNHNEAESANSNQKHYSLIAVLLFHCLWLVGYIILSFIPSLRSCFS